jgi:hypothetical protein
MSRVCLLSFVHAGGDRGGEGIVEPAGAEAEQGAGSGFNRGQDHRQGSEFSLERVEG